MEENTNPEQAPETIVYEYDPQQATRANIETVLSIWNTIGETESWNQFITRNDLEQSLEDAKVKTLEILFKQIDYLHRDELPELYEDD